MLDIQKYKFKNMKYIFLQCILLLTFCLIAVGTSSADSITDIHENLDENLGDSECMRCHTSHDVSGTQTHPVNTLKDFQT